MIIELSILITDSDYYWFIAAKTFCLDSAALTDAEAKAISVTASLINIGDSVITRSPPIGWGRQNTVPLKFDPKPSEAAFLAVFRPS